MDITITYKKEIQELSAACIDNCPVDIDWSDISYEEDEVEVFDADMCEKCNKIVFLPYQGAFQHCELGEDLKCTGYLYSDGPMMNYYYPIPEINPLELVEKIHDLPLCVVCFNGKDWGLALTGGGMDLSWEICLAHIRLGFLPPFHFADLPEFAGKCYGRNEALIIRAFERVFDIKERNIAFAKQHLTHVKKYLKENSEKEKK